MTFAAPANAPTEDEINRLEKAAWDANVDHVLVWYRDRIEAQQTALNAAWQDIAEWQRLAREQRAAHPDPNHAPNMPSEAGIEKSERVRQQIAEASR